MFSDFFLLCLAGADLVLHLLPMTFFERREARSLTNAKIHGEFRSHVNRLLIDYPDDCPKAPDIMLFFLSCIADASVVLHLVSIRFFGTSGKNMYIDGRKLGELRKVVVYHYSDICPRLLLKGFEGINLSGWPEIYKEEQRKLNQAKFARRFKVAHK